MLCPCYLHVFLSINKDRHCGNGERELLEGIREGEEKEKCGGRGVTN